MRNSNGAMREEMIHFIFQVIKQPLCLSQAVSQQHTGFAGLLVFVYPLGDAVKDLLLRLPAVNGQTKSRFCNKRMTAQRFKRRRQPIVFQFIIAAGHPYFTILFHPNLRGANHMTGGMQRHFHAVKKQRFTVSDALYLDIVAQPEP